MESFKLFFRTQLNHSNLHHYDLMTAAKKEDPLRSPINNWSNGVRVSNVTNLTFISGLTESSRLRSRLTIDSKFKQDHLHKSEQFTPLSDFSDEDIKGADVVFGNQDQVQGFMEDSPLSFYDNNNQVGFEYFNTNQESPSIENNTAIIDDLDNITPDIFGAQEATPNAQNLSSDSSDSFQDYTPNVCPFPTQGFLNEITNVSQQYNNPNQVSNFNGVIAANQYNNASAEQGNNLDFFQF